MKTQDKNAIIFFTIILVAIIIVRVLTPILHK